MKPTYTTEEEVCEAFFDTFPEYKQLEQYHKGVKQNQYPATVRCAFVNFVDMLSKNSDISEDLARSVTLK